MSSYTPYFKISFVLVILLNDDAAFVLSIAQIMLESGNSICSLYCRYTEIMRMGSPEE